MAANYDKALEKEIEEKAKAERKEIERQRLLYYIQNSENENIQELYSQLVALTKLIHGEEIEKTVNEAIEVERIRLKHYSDIQMKKLAKSF